MMRGLPFYLWTRKAVQQFLAERFEVSVSVWTRGRYLKSQLPANLSRLPSSRKEGVEGFILVDTAEGIGDLEVKIFLRKGGSCNYYGVFRN